MGVECAAMTAEADQIGPEMVLLPGVPAYLKSVFELGRRSFRPALPSLAFLFLCRLGMDAYGVLTNYSYALGKGATDVKAAISAAPLLFFFLIYIPFLPLQESLLRGHPIHFPVAIRRVLRVSVSSMLLGIAQVLILLGPISPIFFPRLVPGPWWTYAWTFLAPLLYAFIAWMLVASFFMIFAMPAVVLDGEGPLHSLRTSCRLVWRNLGSALGRLLTLAVLAAVAYMVATIPSSILGAAGRTPGVAAAPIKLAALTWTNAADTLFFPFWVAAVMVLYRSLRPWTDEGRA
jgi:hypothetical protein